MAGYDEVDAIIDAWAKANVEKLFDEWAGKPARFAYLPGKRALECFQISIQLPSAGRIVVSAHSVDTDDDSEHHRLWEGPVDSLAAMLEEATDVVRIWVNVRPRTAANERTSGRTETAQIPDISAVRIIILREPRSLTSDVYCPCWGPPPCRTFFDVSRSQGVGGRAI